MKLRNEESRNEEIRVNERRRQREANKETQKRQGV